MTDPAHNEESIFLGAIELTSAEERSAYLGAACGDNQTLRDELEALLRAHERPQPLLDVPEAPAPTVGDTGPPISTTSARTSTSPVDRGGGRSCRGRSF